MNTEEPNSVERGTHRRKAPAPVRVCFAGAGESVEFVPTGRHCSTEDSLRPRAQLRPTFACRRKTNTEEPNSVERGTHRRTAPAPVRVCFAGACARWRSCPPMRGSSQEDKLRIRAQLRLGSGNRRTADCWNRTSVEKGTHRRKAPVPVRVCFAGAEACTKFAPPGSHRSTEDKLGIRAQLRPTFACRRRTNIEEPNSVENGAHRRKAPAPVRVCFAVADARGKCCTPVSRRSSEDRLRFRA